MDLELNSTAERLAAKAQEYDAFTSLSLRHLRGQVAEALTAFGRLGLLDEYTKHDITHIDAMLEMYDWMVPEATRALMTPADWLLITISTYLHDFGLLVTRSEYESRGDLESFANYKRRLLDTDDPETKDYRAQVSQIQDDDSRERFLYQEFVRANHAVRIRAWLGDSADLTWGGDAAVVERLRNILNGVEETFVEDVALVCESHHRDDIKDTRKYPVNRPYGRGREQEANVQFAAFLLRTSDLFHITRDRVPSMAAIVINPRNPKSQAEWAKQAAVRSVRPKPAVRDPETGVSEEEDTIEVHATFKDAEGYFGLTSYLQYAGKQLAQTWLASRDNQLNGTSQYVFPWRKVDTSHIEAKGFVAEPFEFSIDQGKILDLLTGHTLYNDTSVVVRELVQNALDAVRLRKFLDERGNYAPQIVVYWDPSARVLEVSDNGIGMTQSVIVRNFLKVGSSRYQEPEFQKAHPDFAPISRFGIGVLSAFMVADDVSVITSHDDEAQARQLSLRDVHGQYLVRLLDKQSEELPGLIRAHGTSVRLKLRPSAPLADVDEILRHWVVFPGCEVLLQSPGERSVSIGYASVSDALRAILLAEGTATSDKEGRTLVNRRGAEVQIKIVSSDDAELAFAVVWSRWLEEWQFVQFDPSDEDGYPNSEFSRYGICVGGIRVTNEPPGFISGGIAGIANAFGPSAPRTNVARSDLERTDEYDNLMNFLYEAYFGHIVSETHEMEHTRAASLTRAVQEASFLSQDLTRYEVASPEARDRALRTVPGFAVEQDGARSARSLQDLDSEEMLSTIESTSITSLESVLRSVRGTSSASLKNLMFALGSMEVLPEVPLIAGLSSSSFMSRMYSTEWEVVRLEADDEARVLQAEWRKREEPPKWQRVPRRPPLPSGLLSRLERDASIGRAMGDMTLMLLAASDEIEVQGIREGLVMCQRRLLVLPTSPFLAINSSGGDVPEQARLWCIAWLIANSTGARSGPGRQSLGFNAPSDFGGELQGQLLRLFENVGLFDVLDEGSVRAALLHQNVSVFDVSRWDRRQGAAL